QSRGKVIETGMRHRCGEHSSVDAFEQRAKIRRETWRGFVAHSPAQAATFEREAVIAMTPEERVAAIWELVLRMPWGSDGTEHRLDRSLARVERRKR
ncbi:MAG TPA: hypothetical protein VMV73_05415, partial [Candidatus Dormibacteraeota bacterium]|nr:hypothetical protein [Candidatus Dormibacteraeota bacterium]